MGDEEDEGASRGFVIRDKRVSSSDSSDEPEDTKTSTEPEDTKTSTEQVTPEAGAASPESDPGQDHNPVSASAPETDDMVPGPPGMADDANLPPLNFGTFVLSLGTQVLVALGLVPNPMTQEKEFDIIGARQSIDILEILEEKTRGNLTKDEEQLITDLLYDLRLRFVEVSKGK